MKILQVAASLSTRVGGPRNSILGMQTALESVGLESMIIAPAESVLHPLTDDERHSIESVACVGFVNSPRDPRYSVSNEFRRRLRQYIEWADLVHIHGVYLQTSSLAARMSSEQGRPFTLQPHGALLSRAVSRRKVLKQIYFQVPPGRSVSKASGGVVAHEDELPGLRRLIGMRPGLVLPYAPLSIEMDVVISTGIGGSIDPTLRSLMQRAPCVVFLARKDPQKRLDIILRAWPSIRAAVPDARLMVVGPGFEPDKRRAPSDESIIFTGSIHGADKWELLRSADVLVQPSDRENFGLTVVEAMSVGTPVVVRDTVASSEYVKQAVAGAVLSSTDPLAWARSVIPLLEKSTENARIRDSIRRFSESHLKWEHRGERLRSFFEAIGA